MCLIMVSGQMVLVHGINQIHTPLVVRFLWIIVSLLIIAQVQLMELMVKDIVDSGVLKQVVLRRGTFIILVRTVHLQEEHQQVVNKDSAGIGDFKYPVPDGAMALCSNNLSRLDNERNVTSLIDLKNILVL